MLANTLNKTLLAAPVVLETESYFMLRRPLLPVEGVWELHAGNPSPQESLATLLDFCRQPFVQEALYLASPVFYAELVKALKTPPAAASKDGQRMLRTLYKYFLRMSVRATPYGQFAGSAFGRYGTRTDFAFAPDERRARTRPDAKYVLELVRQLLARADVRRHVRYYPTNSLYLLGGKYRYVESRLMEERLDYELAGVSATPHLTAAVDAARAGATVEELSRAVTAQGKVNVGEARAFVEQLVEMGVLVSELEPPITNATGESFVPELLARVAPWVPAADLAPVREALALGAQGGVVNYERALALLPQREGLHTTKLQHSDLFLRTTANRLSAAVAATITQQAQELTRLPVETRGSETLQAFAVAFAARYEQRLVPLVLALDAELGIGYAKARPATSAPAPLLSDITPAVRAAATDKSLDTKLALALLLRAQQAGSQCVELTEQDLAELEPTPRGLREPPRSLFIVGNLLAASEQALDQGEFQFQMTGFAGPSAATMLGRFCYGDQELREAVRATLQAAEPDGEHVIYAEVVHVPAGHIGNVLSRPTLRTYEIPLLTPAGVADEHQIPLEDLYVAVEGPGTGNVVLYSKRLGKRVIPRLSNAHRWELGLPLYQFLGDLQQREKLGVWRWNALASQPFLPRVTYKNIILSRAQWWVELDKETTESQMTAALDARQLPRYVTVGEGDNHLLIDRESTLGRGLLLDHLLKKGRAQVWEYLATPDQCWLHTAAGRFTSEVVLPVRNFAVEPIGLKKEKARQPETKARTFAPGSEWLYAKLYGGTVESEALLTEAILPLTEDWRAQGFIHKWFFVRYEDEPGLHLRVRFHLTPAGEQQMGRLLRELHALLGPGLASDRLYRVQLDTYQRELERYGAHNIEDTEELFGHDSRATAGVLALLGGPQSEEYRWLLAVRALDEMLTDFGLGLAEKETFLGRRTHEYFLKYGGERELQVQLNERYRQHKAQIEAILDPAQDQALGIEEATALFRRRRAEWAPVIARLRARNGDGLTSRRGWLLLVNWVHMHYNRFTLAQPQLHELVLYSMLHKYYVGQLARQGQKAPAVGRTPPAI